MRVVARLRRWYDAYRRPRPFDEQGEAAAARYLKRLGYKIVARRYRRTWGEIDLVAIDGRTVVFVEVKTRRSHKAGHPAEAVGPEKQRRLVRAALAFLKRRGLLEHAARFDVVAVTWPDERRRPVIEHFRHAFRASGRGQMFA